MPPTKTDMPQPEGGRSLAAAPISQAIAHRVRDFLGVGGWHVSLDAHDAVASTLRDEDESSLSRPLTDDELEDPAVLSAAAAELYRMRRARGRVLPRELTGEPAWDMLLAIYSEGPARMTVSSACYGSGVPDSTALRWLDFLERQQLVERIQHRRDPGLVLVLLTDEGRSLVERAMRAMLRASRS